MLLVPTCSNMDKLMLMAGIGQDPDLADCVSVLQDSMTDNGQLNKTACDCMIKISPEKFYAWTGVQASTCGIGTGLSIEEERTLCVETLSSSGMQFTAYNLQNDFDLEQIIDQPCIHYLRYQKYNEWIHECNGCYST